MGPDKLYEQVSDSDDTLDHLDEEITIPVRRRTQWKRVTLITAGVTALFLTIITLICSVVIHNRHSGGQTDVSTTIITCGQSPEEARTLGCTYDVMMQLWVPQQCYDEVLSERYLGDGNWPWFSDSEGQHEIPMEVMRLGEHQVALSTDEYHRYHCMFTWEVMVRAMRTRGYIIAEMMSYDHVVHCHHMTLAPPRNKTFLGVEAHLGFARCATYDNWIKALPEDDISSLF